MRFKNTFKLPNLLQLPLKNNVYKYFQLPDHSFLVNSYPRVFISLKCQQVH